MKIKNVKPGDVLYINSEYSKEKEEIYFDNKWKVIKVYENVVLTRSVKMPQIRRCFCIGDLVMMRLEGQIIIN